MLKDIRNYIKGDFEYFACPDNYSPPFIKKKDAFLEIDDRYDNGKTRLLSLYGKSNGDLLWKVNQYSDGSGSDSLAIPCKTKEDAIQIVGEHFIDSLTKKKKDGSNFYSMYEKVEFLLINGFEIDAEWKEKSIEYEVKSLKSDVDSRKKDTTNYQRRLDAAEKKLADFCNKANETQPAP